MRREADDPVAGMRMQGFPLTASQACWLRCQPEWGLQILQHCWKRSRRPTTALAPSPHTSWSACAHRQALPSPAHLTPAQSWPPQQITWPACTTRQVRASPAHLVTSQPCPEESSVDSARSSMLSQCMTALRRLMSNQAQAQKSFPFPECLHSPQWGRRSTCTPNCSGRRVNAAHQAVQCLSHEYA